MQNNSFLQCGDFKVFHPMKYCGTPAQSAVDKAMSDSNWVMQQKLDGAFFQLVKNNNGEVGLFSRTISRKDGLYVNKIENVPHIKQWAEFNLPDNTNLLGEIYVEGGHSNDVTKIMGCLPKKAITRQKEQGYVSYNIFDCVYWKDEDICERSFWERYQLLEEHFIELMNDRVANDELNIINLIPCYTLQNENCGIQCESYQEQLNKIFAIGGEGVVFKKKDSIYRPNMRTTASQSFKMKEHIDSIDLVVIDVLDPEMEYSGKELDSWQYYYSLKTKKKHFVPNKEHYYLSDPDTIPVTKPFFYNWKNAIELGAYNKNGELISIGKVASGLTDDIRAAMGANPQDFIGRVVEISCMSIDKKNYTFRHPVFIGFRSDKAPHECLLEDIFGG